MKLAPVYSELVYDVTQNNTNTRYNSLNMSQFTSWSGYSNIATPFINTYFKPNDPFTWNYEFTPIQEHPLTGLVSYDLASSYQSLYTKLYQTPYPNLEPWKLQGYTDKPLWWDSIYADTTGTRTWGGFMWNNILNGNSSKRTDTT